ncbi:MULTISPECIES: flagellar motor protein MotB [Arthrobacter]|uniref:Flagellar motor protein MotB n=2 Tax=Arthrobacter TaxID=1663 RepID=A0ABU9KID7_9MICC|nr:flagellar motor protein MotB [Arthrobacter sp. YJM1]MDP5226333.1 flagellar motor protein MotB [Arthrobacter sp. YJM1]
MSPRRRRRPPRRPAEFHVDERWAVSYMDMITVLFCLFVVLFAMSTVDQNKFEKLRNSLATGFGTTVTQKIDTAMGTVVPPAQANKEAQGFANLDLALKEAARLTALEKQMNQKLTALGIAPDVQFQIDQRGLTVKLVGSQTFFQPDSPDLTPRADKVLDAVTPAIVPTTLEVSVEGHTANIPTAYPTGWELSSSRATNVLRHMVENDALPPHRIGATGYGSARPVNADHTEAEHEQNRRVDIVVLSDQPEAVRALIPEALKALVGQK